jgi:RNA polymerase sigma-70 factor (ECF subfamily)
MPKDAIPLKQPVSPSEDASSGSDSSENSAQLPLSSGVQPTVSSLAINQGVLALGGAASRTRAESQTSSGDLTNDAEVMLRVKAGDDSAFEYLVQKYRRPMISFMYRMAHNSAAAEDLAQEVFLRVYRSRANYQASAKFSTWLYRIATNLAVNHARDTRHQRPESTVSLDVPDAETGQTMDVPDPKSTVEQNIVRRERLAAIRQKVQALPERQKLAVMMHKYEQMDYKQIGEVLKLSESATKSLLFRAYETLRTELKEFL